jgi:monofunctional biosynthetic peptidoglycan transglycosylase
MRAVPRWPLAVLLGAVALAGAGAWSLRGLPDPSPLKDPAWVRQRFQLRDWTPLASVPPLVQRCILVSEDDSFFEHSGLRLDEWGSAAWDDLSSLRYKRGASSITQQVVRNAFLSKDKRLSRKLRELWLAREADRAVGKEQLLEDYLNLAEWGSRGERGIAAAAREHFGKAPADLSVGQGALLAWLLPQPRLRGRALRHGPPPQALRHVRRILRRLERDGDLDEATAEALIKDPLSTGSPQPPMPGGAAVPKDLDPGGAP